MWYVLLRIFNQNLDFFFSISLFKIKKDMRGRGLDAAESSCMLDELPQDLENRDLHWPQPYNGGHSETEGKGGCQSYRTADPSYLPGALGPADDNGLSSGLDKRSCIATRASRPRARKVRRTASRLPLR